MTSSEGAIKAAVAGLGMAGNGLVRTLSETDGVQMVAASDLREHALDGFSQQYGGKGYTSIGQICDDPSVEAVWVATPTHLHAQHAVMLANAGKHVVVEKPMAVTLDECDMMIEAAAKNNVTLLAGGARSFDPAFVAMRQVITSGRLGKLAALSTFSFTTWMTRAREPHEVDVNRGGGAIYNQAAHPLDVLRLLGGGLMKSIRGITVDTGLPGRPCPGYFTAIIEFENGVPATLVYDGYGFIQGWEFLPWGETPERQRAADASNAYRRALRNGTADELEAREQLRYSGLGSGPGGAGLRGGEAGWTPQDAGMVVATCELGEIRQSKDGLYVYDDEGRHDEPLPANATHRANEVAELRDGMAGRRRPLHDGAWGKATIEAMLALMQSAREHREIDLRYQVPVA